MLDPKIQNHINSIATGLTNQVVICFTIIKQTKVYPPDKGMIKLISGTFATLGR